MERGERLKRRGEVEGSYSTLQIYLGLNSCALTLAVNKDLDIMIIRQLQMMTNGGGALRNSPLTWMGFISNGTLSGQK